MIKIIYSNNVEEYYLDKSIAKFMLLNKMFESRGGVLPVAAIDIFGTTAGGIRVEKELSIEFGMIVFE